MRRPKEKKLYIMTNITVLIITCILALIAFTQYNGGILSLSPILLSMWKIGISNSPEIHRQKQVSKAAPGRVVLVCTWSVRNAYRWEQTFHKICAPLSVRYYSGDGYSEWFLFPAAALVLLIMIVRFAVYLAAVLAVIYLAIQYLQI